jgi:CxxC-x17-CxxC domain-containing protein
MGNFQGGGNRGGGFRGGNGGGGRPSFGGNRGGDRGPVTMHKAVCDECHKSCEVPFRPSGDKPIYCSDCFGEKRGNEAPRREFSDRAPRRDFNDRPEQSSSFSKPVSTGPSMSDDTKKQLGEMNSKLDRLINAIEKLSQPKAVAMPAIKVAPIAAKIEVKKAPVVKAVVKKVIAAKAPAKKVEVKKVLAKKR